MSRKGTVLSRRQVEGMIAEGKKVVIVDGNVLKVDGWVKFHPGGDKAIMHMVGRDATDEVNALHSAEARKYMNTFQVGTIQGPWQNFLPPIQGGRFRPCGEVQVETEEPELPVSDPSSIESSRSQSPVFDLSEHTTSLRQRASRSSSYGACSSSTSLSSDDFASSGEEVRWSKMSHMDVYTKEAIDLDCAKYPTLDVKTQQDIQARYRALDERIRSEGLYQCNYTAYAVESCRYALLFGFFALFLKWGWYGTSGLFLGMLWHQLVFTAHDAGHMGITHSFVIDTAIGIIIADFMGGLSLGWWKRSHNVHHIVTNSAEHDPDIQHLPFFAVSHRFFESLYSTYHDHVMRYESAFARFMIPYQHYLYYPILMFGRFNLYVQSFIYLFSGQAPKKGPAWWTRWFEMLGQLFFWAWFGYGVVYRSIPSAWGRFVFVMVSHVVTMPVHVQITLSHFAMSTADLGVNESFPQRMLRTTMDVDCPQWLDFFHGGLQFQAVHHLYPRIPRHNLRRTQRLVLEFCRDVGIPYALFGFVDGSKAVIGKLSEVGRQAAILAECRQTMAASGDFVHR